MGGAGKGEPPEDRGERVISEAVERSNILFIARTVHLRISGIGRTYGA
jgi:hypothetical protein